jgi:hypothetical protein
MTRGRGLLKAFSTGTITLEEYVLNLSFSLSSVCDKCIDICVSSIPDHVVGDFFTFLDRFLTTVDFMPCPKPFLAGTPSDEDIERAKRQRRPKYIHLFEATKARAFAAGNKGNENATSPGEVGQVSS